PDPRRRADHAARRSPRAGLGLFLSRLRESMSEGQVRASVARSAVGGLRKQRSTPESEFTAPPPSLRSPSPQPSPGGRGSCYSASPRSSLGRSPLAPPASSMKNRRAGPILFTADMPTPRASRRTGLSLENSRVNTSVAAASI